MISYIALIMVDMQNDFLPGGALAVPEGDKIIPLVNQYTRFFSNLNLPVYFTRDWHPEETVHFKQGGGPWPSHCIQNTPGAEFHPDVFIPDKAEILSKGMDPRYDGYSAFDARSKAGKRFPDLLKDQDISTFYMTGKILWSYYDMALSMLLTRCRWRLTTDWFSYDNFLC